MNIHSLLSIDVYGNEIDITPNYSNRSNLNNNNNLLLDNNEVDDREDDFF